MTSIQMKAIEQYVPVVLFTSLLYKVVLIFETADKILSEERKLLSY